MMRKTLLVVSVLVVAVTLLWCQASLGEERTYTNQQYGFSFPIPKGMKLYTPEHPGPFTFKSDNILFLANRMIPSEFIMMNVFAAKEKDLQNLKSSLDSRESPQEGYKKVSVQYNTIGKNQGIRAVEHIFHKGGNTARTMRQVFFIRKGKGLCFTASANADRFQEANKALFEPVFRSITFE